MHRARIRKYIERAKSTAPQSDEEILRRARDELDRTLQEGDIAIGLWTKYRRMSGNLHYILEWRVRAIEGFKTSGVIFDTTDHERFMRICMRALEMAAAKRTTKKPVTSDGRRAAVRLAS